ncbi:MAG: DUF3987 domain-containing protein, partial [Nitrospinaceae bacterium]|nr:DUF3987 domain-containing protein [Nitrospinaceae bacterium]
MHTSYVAPNPVDSFTNAMAEADIETSDTIISNGKIHRLRVAGDKQGEKSGWYVLYPDDPPAGAFGNWRSGVKSTWCSKKGKLTKEESVVFKKKMDEARVQREAEEHVRHLKARKRAKAEWSSAHPATPVHPYLAAKSVMPHGLKVNAEGQLLVPLYSADGKISTLEYIASNGDKKFMYEGRKSGCFYPFSTFTEEGEKEIIILAEGFATSATILEAQELPTVAAMDAGNLKAVAEALRKKFPDAQFIFAADNDEHGRGKKDAIEAAQTVGGRVVVCPEDGDFNDLAQAKGLEAVKAVINTALNASPALSVVDLVPGAPGASFLFDGPHVSLDTPDLPQLKPSFFPSWLGDMVAAVSEATETPPELPGLTGLGVVAACVQGKAIVSPSPDYREPLSIFVAPALDSGNRKTSVLNEMTKPLRDWEREQTEKLQPEVDKAVSDRKTLEARVEYLRKKAAKADGLDLENLKVEIAEIEKSMPEVLSIPRIWTQDVTPERLGSLMAENGEGISIISDEGGIFEILGGRYSNGIPNLDLFLQAHAGAPVRVDRGSRPPVHLQNPALTVALSPQTDVIRGLAQKSGFRGRGLLARFHYALPPSPLGYRKLESKPIPQSVREAYSRGIYNLLEIPSAIGQDGKPAPIIFEYSEDGYREWHDFSLMIEQEMREEGKFFEIKDWAGKL